jgi:hypothetical protein
MPRALGCCLAKTKMRPCRPLRGRKRTQKETRRSLEVIRPRRVSFRVSVLLSRSLDVEGDALRGGGLRGVVVDFEF